MFPLRDYQVQLINNTKQEIHAGKHSILCVSPTGSGKTVIFSHIAANALEKNKKVLILTHRQEIFDQTVKKLYEYKISPGQIIAGRDQTRNPIQVAMISTLVKRLDSQWKYDLIITDEAQHTPARTWRTVIDHFSTGDNIHLGFTATPERLSGEGMGDIYESMVLGKDTFALVYDGYLSLPICKTAPNQCLYKFHTVAGDYDTKEQEEILSSNRLIIGDVIDEYRQYLNHQPGIVFVPTLAYGYDLEKQLKDAGILAVMIEGGTKYQSIRRKAVQGLSNGTVELILSRDVITEGFDVPACVAAFILRKTASLSLFLQMAGRPLRPVYKNGYYLDSRPGRLAAIKAGPKPNAYIFDHVGNIREHGHPLEPRHWSLEGITRKQRQDEVRPPWICPRCRYEWPAFMHTCPQCGYELDAARAARLTKKYEHIKADLVDAIPGIDNADLEIMADLLNRSKDEQVPAMAEAAMERLPEGIKKNLHSLKDKFFKDGYLNAAWGMREKLHGGK